MPFLERIEFRDKYLAARPAKAAKILALLRREKKELNLLSLLDVGCSHGGILEFIAPHCRLGVGIDLDLPPARENRGFHFVQGDGCCLPIASEAFDVVLLNHILEHVPDKRQLLEEAWRILKPAGFCYLAVPNRLSWMEPHYRLPFLSWLPERLAHRYVRWTGRGNQYLDRMPTFWELRKLVADYRGENLSLQLVKNAEDFFPPGDPMRQRAVRAKILPCWLLLQLLPFFPVWALILRKPAR
jgi:SAM-dependent methyltransferase